MKPNVKTTVAGADSAAFQPTVLIAAEIAFAAVLLYMSNQPVDLSQDSIAQGEPAVTINIPANVAVASTEMAEIEQPLMHIPQLDAYSN